VARILEDRDGARLNEPADADPHAAAARLATLAPGLVTWAGWTAIDAHERAAGEPHGRPRVKVVRMARLRELAGPG
jgi:ferredoxin/flavodoxin---NADP+ reductase